MDNSHSERRHTNRLAGETSPYLLSHAHNPVDWYPWGDEAIQKARREGKPIFLSIGYSACHWCHVMERESFESESIAAILNEHYVAIKVDREERPDLDHIYMTFTQAMAGNGGWPMSVFLTPDLKPFFAGTYFPAEDVHGRPGFRTVLTEVAAAYRENRGQIVESAEGIAAEIGRYLTAAVAPTLLTPGLIAAGAQELMRGVDERYGGIGGAPKFPHATELSLLLRHYKHSGDLSCLRAVTKALDGMARGGVNDQLGGGFARYSVDQRWLVPHFEKMLYDNALLVPLYAEAYLVTKDERYKNVVIATLDFVLREMTDATGGFYSAIDADSEGEEGKYYVWTKGEIVRLLGDSAELFCRYYGVSESGNFEGKNILHLSEDSDRLRNDPKWPTLETRLMEARQTLLAARHERVRPLADDKILISWNGLMLVALCRGYRLTRDRRYLDAAVKNATFVQDVMCAGGTLSHSYRAGVTTAGPFLEDYGYYLAGLVELFQVDTSHDSSRRLAFACRLADEGIRLFMDSDGTLYLREGSRSDLIVRPRAAHDEARPAPGSYLIMALMKLGRLTGKTEYAKAGERALRAVSGLMSRQPGSMAGALLALDYLAGSKTEVVIVGDGPEREEMLGQVFDRYMPNALVVAGPEESSLSPLLAGRKMVGGQVAAYVCRDSVCRLPVTSGVELDAELAGAD